MNNKNPYLYETTNFRFTYHNGSGVTISFKDGSIIKPQYKPTDNGFNTDIAYDGDGRLIGLHIPEYAEQARGRNGGFLIQHVLSAFSWTFAPQEDHREQLLAGLKYYVIAENFKLMVSSDVALSKLEALQKDYEGLKEAYPKHCVELNDLEQKATELHINEPLVGTTGFMAYPTRDYIWIMFETDQVNPKLPEYYYEVQKKTAHGEFEAPLVGTQQECIVSVMEDQVEAYGMSIETLSRKRQDNKQLLRMFEDLEIVLKIPKEETWEYMKNKKEMDDIVKDLTDANVNQLINY